MTGNMMVFGQLCLILCWMLPADSMTIRFNFSLRDPTPSIPLDMVEDSVDDMYFGCNETMMEKVEQKYLQEEREIEPFAKAWKQAEKCANRKLKDRQDEALTKYHLQAICAYTSDNVYQEFNVADRTQGSSYGSSSFNFHSLHFLLTSAIQILNSNNQCHNTYRRSPARFTGKVNGRMRFGQFASSSFSKNLEDFGSESCFKIETCAGAPLKNYSIYDDTEAEVLIPPYEVFKIIDIITGQENIHDISNCKVLFVLKSFGVISSLNCRATYKWQPSGSSSSGGEIYSAIRKPATATAFSRYYVK